MTMGFYPNGDSAAISPEKSNADIQLPNAVAMKRPASAIDILNGVYYKNLFNQ